MKFPEWFRYVWWIAITIATGWLFFVYRVPVIQQNGGAVVDIFIFLVFTALLLVPVFQEFSFAGLSLKQRLDEIANNLQGQIQSIRQDIHAKAFANSNATINFASPPPSDQSLPEIKRMIEEMFAKRMPEAAQPAPIQQPDDSTMFLFQTRYSIEKELRRIESELFDMSDNRRFTTIGQIASKLVNAELLPPDLAGAIREVYAVCSPAIHGQPVTVDQIDFVRDVAPKLISALKNIQG